MDDGPLSESAQRSTCPLRRIRLPNLIPEWAYVRSSLFTNCSLSASYGAFLRYRFLHGFIAYA